MLRAGCTVTTVSRALCRQAMTIWLKLVCICMFEFVALIRGRAIAIAFQKQREFDRRVPTVHIVFT